MTNLDLEDLSNRSCTEDSKVNVEQRAKSFDTSTKGRVWLPGKKSACGVNMRWIHKTPVCAVPWIWCEDGAPSGHTSSDASSRATYDTTRAVDGVVATLQTTVCGREERRRREGVWS